MSSYFEKAVQTAKQDIDRGLALGANAYVPKPFSPEQLRATVDKLFGGSAHGG